MGSYTVCDLVDHVMESVRNDFAQDGLEIDDTWKSDITRRAVVVASGEQYVAILQWSWSGKLPEIEGQKAASSETRILVNRVAIRPRWHREDEPLQQIVNELSDRLSVIRRRAKATAIHWPIPSEATDLNDCLRTTGYWAWGLIGGTVIMRLPRRKRNRPGK